MNVLEFADYQAPYAGNFIASLKNLQEHFTDGNMVFLFTNGARERTFLKELGTVYFLTESTVENIRIFRRILKEEKIDLIHTHFSVLKYDLPLKIARLFSRKTCYVRHMHMTYKNKANSLYEKLKRFISNGNREIACGKGVYDNMLSLGFGERLYLVENAVDFSRLDQYEELEKGAQTELLMFGYHYEVKGVDLAVKAAASLEGARLNIVLAANGEETEKKIVKEFGAVPEYVRFLPPRNDIASYYRMADVFLAPSREEGAPYAVIEAMYCEVPVVASGIAAHGEVPPALLFEKGNPEDLARKIKEALELPDRKAFCAHLREQVMDKYGMDRWSERVLEVFQSCRK